MRSLPMGEALGHRADPRVFIGEILTVARYGLIAQQRNRSWILNTSLTPFFLLAPLVFVANSFLGQPGPARQEFVRLTGYDNYLGFMIVPLIDATMTSTVYSNIGHTIRFEQISGTLERLLMSLRYPVSLILGRSLAFLAFVLWFAGTALGLCWFFFGLTLDVSPASAAVLLPLHFLLVYGTAFLMSSVFLWISDAMAVQMLFSRFVLLTLAGATYPVTMLPGWLQPLARAIPFTWLYELYERAAFVRAAPPQELRDGLLVLAAMVVVLWVAACVFFRAMLDHAKRTGRLGMY
jgi:ABC-2 type transport system permease protein